jgi:hypothetical protein
MQHVYEHPSGVLLHVQFEPAKGTTLMRITDVRVADTATYEPTGPNLAPMLHTTYTVDVNMQVDTFLADIAKEILDVPLK